MSHTPPWEQENPPLCDECGGIVELDGFCHDCGKECEIEENWVDDYYDEKRLSREE